MLFVDLIDRVSIVKEGVFRKSSELLHILDVPMFSIFLKRDLGGHANMFASMMEDDLKRAFSEARTRIQKLGFPSMHSNVVFKDLNREKDLRVRKTRTLGGAHGNPKHKVVGGKNKLRSIELNSDFLYTLDESGEYELLVDTIVHEWAHLWMFNNGKEFRNAVNEYYNNLYFSQEDLLSQKATNRDYIKFILDPKIKTELANLVKWVNAYGMGSDDEVWATAIAGFEKLHPYHKKNILKMINFR